MKTLKIYLDTSVIGGCFDDEFRTESNEIFKMIKLGIYDPVISTITINGLINAPKQVNELLATIEENLLLLEVNDEVIKLSSEYLKENIITEKFKEDALHIALATVYNIDVLITWNFKHIVNLNKIKLFNAVNLRQGYKELEIRSPKELINN